MAGRVAVADTSVLIAFHQLELLGTLSLFYQRVLVPAAVRAEFLKKEERLRGGTGAALTVLISQPPFEPCDDYDTIEVELLLAELDRGESEALSQLKRRNADHVLMDERAGREFALRQGFKPVGTLRLLAHLHLQGYLADVPDAVRQLRKEIRFRASDSVVEKAMREARTDPIV